MMFKQQQQQQHQHQMQPQQQAQQQMQQSQYQQSQLQQQQQYRSSPLLWKGALISTRRGLLASLWTLVMILTAIAFVTALFFSITAENNNNNNNNNYQQQQQDYTAPEIAVTSRAMTFVALWTAVLASLMGIFGTVILGWQSPTGQYYTCCSSKVFRTTQLGLGSFIGTLLMFSNLTLVCSVLFGEFQIRDYQHDDQKGERSRYTSVERSSMAFSIMCMFLTVLYASFAALTFVVSKSILEEHETDAGDSTFHSSSGGRGKILHYNGYDGYIGERFDVRRTNNVGGFVSNPSEGLV